MLFKYSFLNFDVNQHSCKSVHWYEEIKCLVIQVAGPGTAWKNVSLLNEDFEKVQFCDLRNPLVLFQNSG